MFTFLLLSGKDIVAKHFPIFLFLLVLLPSVINIATTGIFRWDLIHFSVFRFLDSSDYIVGLLMYFFEVLMCVFCYKYFTLSKSSKYSRKNEIRDLEWRYFSSRWRKVILNNSVLIAVIFVLIGMLIRYGVYGYEAFSMPVKASSVEEIRQSSYGRSQVLESLFLGIVPFLFFIFMEFRCKFRTALVFIYLAIMPLVSGSKAGFILTVFNGILYLIIRRRIRLRMKYVVGVLILMIPSFILGTTFRVFHMSVGKEKFALEEVLSKLTLWGWTADIARRDTSLGQTLIMLTDTSFYSKLIPQYQASVFLLAIPSFVWPGKPISPTYAIATLFGYSTQALAPGWLGGLMFFFGPLALFLGPLIIGYTLAFFSKQFSNAGLNPSFKYPILYLLLWQYISMLMDGTYHSVLANIIAIIMTLSLYYIALLFLNGRMGVPPIMKKFVL
jgi:hypothetical protein